MSITSEAKRCRMTRLTCSMSPEIGASKLAALGGEVAVDDMIKKMCGAADYKGLCGSPRGARERLRRFVPACCASRPAQGFDLAANPMYNHAFSRTCVGRKYQEASSKKQYQEAVPRSER